MYNASEKQIINFKEDVGEKGHNFQCYDNLKFEHIDYFLEEISIANTEIQLRPIKANRLTSPSWIQNVRKLRGGFLNVRITSQHDFC